MAFPSPILVHEDALEVIDCRALPDRVEYLRFTNVSPVAQALRDCLIFGPTLIPSAVCHAVALEARAHRKATSVQSFHYALQESLYVMRAARPQSRPLQSTVEKLTEVVRQLIAMQASVQECCQALLHFAHTITSQLQEQERLISQTVRALLPANGHIMLIGGCGRLSSSGEFSVVQTIVEAIEAGHNIRISVPLSYPLRTGARVSGFELQAHGLPYDLISDSLVSARLMTEKYDAVFTIATRLMRNGDASCAAGSGCAAFSAKFSAVPFYVITPDIVADPSTPDLKTCPLEEMVPEGEPHALSTAMNGLIPQEVITGYVTAHGYVPNKGLTADNGLAQQLSSR